MDTFGAVEGTTISRNIGVKKYWCQEILFSKEIAIYVFR